MLDQVSQIFIQVTYEQLGVDGAYNSWLYIQFVEILLVHVLSSVWIFFKGKQNFPEIDGFEGKNFPGKKRPKLPHPVPRKSGNGSEAQDNILPGGVNHTIERIVNESSL